MKKWLLIIFVLILFSFSVASLECKDFKEKVYLYSEYNQGGDLIKFHKWKLDNSCPGKDCFLQSVDFQIRQIEYNQEGGDGFIKLANPSEGNLEDMSMSLFSHTIKTKSIGDYDNQLFNWYWTCETYPDNNLCFMNKKDGFNGRGKSLVIGIFLKKDTSLDIDEIKYTWCWEKSEIKPKNNEFEDKGIKMSLLGYVLAGIIILLVLIYILIKQKKTKGKRY